MPLTQRLTLALTVASAFVATLIAFLGADRNARQQHQVEASAQLEFSQQFAERIAPLLDRGDLLRLSVLATAGRDLAHARLLVLDRAGRVALDTGLVLGDRHLGLLTAAGPFQRTVAQGDERVRETLVPVRFGGEPIGEVRLQAPRTERASVFDLGLFALVFLCCISLVAVAGLMCHHWSARVRAITDSLVQLATGNLTAQPAQAAPGELQQLDEVMHELEKGVQDGLHRVVEPFVAMARQIVEALEQRGLVPAGHAERTARYALRLAERLELLPDDRRDLELACRLQDLGKAWLRPAVLVRREPLRPADQKSLQAHPVHAADHLGCLPGLRRVATIIRHRFEHHDGRGGPDALRGDRIPIGSRVLSIASSFDLLTTCGDGRPLPWRTALERMAEDRGEVFDPWLFDLFADEIRRDPPVVQSDRPVMIVPGGSAPYRVESSALDEEGLDYDLGQELEVMLDEMPPEERA